MHKIALGLGAAATLGLATYQRNTANARDYAEESAPRRVEHYAVGLRPAGQRAKPDDDRRCDVIYTVSTYRVKGKCVTFKARDVEGGDAEWCGSWVLL